MSSASALAAVLGWVLTSAPAADVPLRVLAQADAPAAPSSSPASRDTPPSLLQARRLSTELRYEEAVIEYQRYLGLVGRPSSERAQAMFELAFINGILGDEVTARRLALEALGLSTDIRPPAGSSRKGTEFLERMQREFNEQVRLELQPAAGGEPPERVTVKRLDPKGRVAEVRLRHALSPDGPYFSAVMRCGKDERCSADIPPSQGSGSVTTYYFVEAVDASQQTLASVASPQAPLRVALAQRERWYESPWVWAGAGAGIVAVAAVVFFASAPAK